MKVSIALAGLLSLIAVARAAIIRYDIEAAIPIELIKSRPHNVNFFGHDQDPKQDSNQIPFGEEERRRHRSSIHPSMMRETHDLPIENEGILSPMVTISLGTPRQDFKVSLDLGTAHFYVPSSHCQACYFQRRYDGSASLTHVNNGTLFAISGAAGVVSQDVLHLDDLQIKDQQFGEALSLLQWNLFGRDGTLGLGYDPQEPNSSATGPEPFLVKLRRHSAIDEPVLGLYLGNKFKGPYGGGMAGQLTIGGVDDYRFKGRLQWVDVVRPGQWSVDLKEVVIDWDQNNRKANEDDNQITLVQDTRISNSNSNSNSIWPSSKLVPAHLRPQGAYISIPSIMARNLNEALGLTESQTEKNVYYYFGCSTLDFDEMPNVGVRIGRAVYWFTPQEYLVQKEKDECYSQFFGLASGGIEKEEDIGAVLGGLFMRKFFTALDFEAHQAQAQQQRQEHRQPQQQEQEQQQLEQGSITLPIEILQAIGAFLDPIALHRACQVNRFWCHCLRPALWFDIPSRALVSRTFIDQFAHYAHFIRHLAIIVPEDAPQVQALVNLCLTRHLDENQSYRAVISESVPPKTLLDCISLSTIEVDLRSTTPNPYPDDLSVTNPISDLLEHHANRLRKVTLIGLQERCNNKLLRAIHGMQHLNSLSLLQWGFPNLNILYEILLYCQSLRTLSLEIDGGIMVEQLTRFKAWRTRYLNLVLDQSVLSIDLVMVLCSLMPGLRSISMKDTAGLVDHVSFFDHEEYLVDIETGEVEAAADPTHGSNFDEYDSSAEGYEGDYYYSGLGDDHYHASDPSIASGEAGEGQEVEEEETDVDLAEGNQPGSIAPVNILTGAPYNDDDDDDDDEYIDYDDSNSLYDEYDYDEYDYLYAGGVNIDSLDVESLRALEALRKFCPLLKHLDFSGCSSDMQEGFYVRLLKLWGENLEGLLARDTCHFSDSTFELVANHGQNLVHLDLSFEGSTRSGGISRGVYYDSILRVFESCPLLESLFVAPYVIDANEIAKREVPWVCVKLRHLSLCVEYRLDSQTGNDEGRYEESARINREVFRQLALLSGLETLEIQGGCDFNRRAAAVLARGRSLGNETAAFHSYDLCLKFSLQFGLDQLSTLKCLKSLDMSKLGPNGMSEEDLAWIAREWLALEQIEGYYSSSELEDIAVNQKRKVDEAIKLARRAQTRESKVPIEGSISSERSTKGSDCMNRPQEAEIWQCRVPLLPEAEICASGRLKSLENSRLDVIVDASAMERTLAMHDLKIFDEAHPSNSLPGALTTDTNSRTPKMVSEDSPLEREDEKQSILDQVRNQNPLQRVVGYTRCPVQDELLPKRRPGGIANDELMANVMRPRQEGRSPSPLGTWY
ncbi:hypothetical protein EMPS_02776 [Entomortierella parvispora]|uniref:Peptidase A1 domain-containing protein n=1 Tax=Entomortierella parvispora TaxID=205924 RepID=A0A9P3H638_9FUNG|nr:hypothetical protein EMPS_02776 [Entomortierella parvispora]